MKKKQIGLFCAMMRFVGAERPINNVRKIIACFIFMLSFWIFYLLDVRILLKVAKVRKKVVSLQTETLKKSWSGPFCS